MLSGPGGQGKSTIAVQLASAIASGQQSWLPDSGLDLASKDPAPVVLWSAEDEGDEVARRLHRIGWQDSVGDRLRYLDGAGMGPLWAPTGGSGHVSTRGGLTVCAAWVRGYAEKFGAVLLVIDATASAYGCDENARALVREHCASWDAWGRAQRCAVMLIGHPPKSGSDYSGSTDWHAAARWRWAYNYQPIPDGEQDDVAPRLALAKGNYSRVGKDGERWIARHLQGPWAATSAQTARGVHVAPRPADLAVINGASNRGDGFDGVVA